MQRATVEALTRALDAFVDSLVQAYDLPGVNVAVAWREEVVWQGAYGFSDIARGDRTGIETVFHSGSMGKVYTAIAVMQLAERGLVCLEDRADRYLPFTLENPLGGAEIRIEHLLTHTSGLGGDAAGCVLAGNSRPLDVALAASLKLDNQPLLGGVPTWTQPCGALRQYSNLGIALLGLVVQRANTEGIDYSTYVQRHIMDPLGMRHAQYPPAQDERHVRPDIWARMSTGYNTMGSVWFENPPICFEEYPAGGFVATPADHVRVFMALANGGVCEGTRILAPDSVTRMLTPAVDGSIVHYGVAMPRERQGLVFWLRDWDSRLRAFHHGGGHMFGWRTWAIAWPEFQVSIVFAINRWGSGAASAEVGLIDHFVENWLRSLPEPLPEVPDVVHSPWKASYLRGLLYAEAYGTSIGLMRSLREDEVRAIARGAVIRGDDVAAALWDEQAFVEGVLDMSAVERTRGAIRDFADSAAMRISLAEARRLFRHVGGGPGSMADLAGLLAGH